jgi:AbiV family abortive infection protein
MRSRAIKDLARYKDCELFSAVAEGLAYIHENANRLADAALILNENQNIRGVRILESIAKEEAAKYLILLDAIRCPRKPDDRFSQHLEKFNQHLAKGLYADACNWRPIHFREIKELIQSECDEYYLDGPNDIDWIFENWIIRQREEAFYVDYVDNEGKHAWLSPKTYEDISLAAPLPRRTPAVVELANDLHLVGFSKPDSLSIVAAIWRPVSIIDETRFQDLRELIHRNLEKLASADVLAKVGSRIEERWPFPLYDLEMREIPTKKSKLKEIQERWYPEL